ncbi:MAG: HNH endonuclease [Pseudonocardia sp.]|nr:HNH endonuclease [Pseudonocardia sp.]MBO0875925.1 HNH endonuclease [Pseudonocardia sp.]
MALPYLESRRNGSPARLRALITDRGGNPFYLRRTRRLVPKTLLAALRFRDQGCCRFPGCTHTRWLQAHHIRPWLRGGRTDIHNLVPTHPEGRQTPPRAARPF